MAGLHGKSAELRLSVSETPTTGITLTQIGSTRIYQAPSGSRDWKWGEGLTTVTVDFGATTQEIDPDGPYIHYPGGAIFLPYEMGDPSTVSGISADAVVMDLAPVSAKTGCTREFDVSIETEVLDATCMGDSYKSHVTGIPVWSGSLQGLYLDASMWGLAVAGISGIVPSKVLRFRPDPLKPDLVYQGTALFPRHEISAGYDSLVEENIDFQGTGPFQAIGDDGVPLFPNLS